MTEAQPSKASKELALIVAPHGALTRVAKRLGKSVPTVSRWARAQRKPGSDDRDLIARRLKIPRRNWSVSVGIVADSNGDTSE